MYGVSNITLTEDVTLVTFPRVPADLSFSCEIFDVFSKGEISVDMISQTSSAGADPALSFTVPGDCIGRVLEIVASYKDEHPHVKPLVSSGNCKISLYGKEMPYTHGVASRALQAASRVGTDILMITTSEVDMSLLMPRADMPELLTELEKTFMVKCG